MFAFPRELHKPVDSDAARAPELSLEPKFVRATELKPLISLTLISLIGTSLPQMGSEVLAQKAMNNRSQGRMLPEHANC
jgi:hypothetical protein